MQTSKRLVALDAFRGLTIAAMITVNTPGSWRYIYSPLRHSSWHGCTPTDLVFPFFLFAVGVAMWFSFKKFNYQLSRAASLKILRRTALIFLIGLLLNAFPFVGRDYSHLRIMGVLQRIALAYGIGGFICLGVNRKWHLPIAGSILLLYWGLTSWLGGADPYSLANNISIPIDKAILGANHMYKGFGIAFDPEGLYSTIPAIVTVMLGFFTGRVIASNSKERAVSYLLFMGCIAVALGSIWNLVFPINKPLWTSSYVLYAAGLAQLVLGVMIFLIDIKGWKKWSHPFLVFGMNSLFIFVLSVVWVKVIAYLIHIPVDGKMVTGYSWLYHQGFASWAGAMNGSLFFALFHIVMYWLIVLVLYKKKIFIKI